MTIGSIRTVSKRHTDTKPEPGEIVIDIDRPSGSVLQNEHPMKTQSLAERERVIQANWEDTQRDIAVKGPRYQELERITDLLMEGHNVAVRCWCAPCACHGDSYVAYVRQRVQERLREAEGTTEPSQSPHSP